MSDLVRRFKAPSLRETMRSLREENERLEARNKRLKRALEGIVLCEPLDEDGALEALCAVIAIAKEASKEETSDHPESR